MGFFADAYDLFIIGVAAALITTEWHVASWTRCGRSGLCRGRDGRLRPSWSGRAEWDANARQIAAHIASAAAELRADSAALAEAAGRGR